MIRSLKLRAVIILAVIVWALVYIAPTMFNTTPGWWPDFLPNKKINLGLDLKGGMHLILEVETDEAVKSTLDRYSDNIAQVFKENKIRFKDIKRKGLTLIVHLNEASKTEAEKILPDEFPNVEIKEAANEKLVLGFTEKYIKYLTDFAVGQAVTTIRNRIDQFGVTEPDIRAMGNERILVELPGIKDPDRALKIIGKTARLEFKLVNEDFDLKNFNPDKIPEDSQLLYKTNRDEFGKVISK